RVRPQTCPNGRGTSSFGARTTTARRPPPGSAGAPGPAPPSSHATTSSRCRPSTRPSRSSPPTAAPSALLLVGVLELALGCFLEGHRQVVLRARLHERRRGILETDALTQLVVVVVDLASPLGSDDHERIARIDVVQQLVYARMDHGEDGT